jgi:hypothetical protein
MFPGRCSTPQVCDMAVLLKPQAVLRGGLLVSGLASGILGTTSSRARCSAPEVSPLSEINSHGKIFMVPHYGISPLGEKE